MSQELTSKLDALAIKTILGQKNLLAFSGGVDSSALFFLLLELEVEFDAAIVNYNTRESCKLEEEYAEKLCKTYGKRLYTRVVSLPQKNFEAEARRIRYDFFEEEIKNGGYDNLITAHQLNDRLEWFLMRLSKGAGIRELIGAKSVEKRGFYSLVRPLLSTSRGEIYEYLHTKNIKYFEDESNDDFKYERNFFRKTFSNKFIESYSVGVKRSFEILEFEERAFRVDTLKIGDLRVFRSKSPQADGANIASVLKELGYVLSKSQREEVLKNYNATIGALFCVGRDDDIIFIAPFIKTTMDKSFKERCREAKIPPKIRGYLYAEKLDPLEVKREIYNLSLYFEEPLL